MKSWRFLTLLVLLGMMAVPPLAQRAAAASVEAARAAFMQLDVVAARAAMEQIVADGGTRLPDRAAAATFLADIALHIDKDPAAAQGWIEKAATYGAAKADVGTLQARRLILSGEPRKAVPLALAATENAVDEKTKHRTTLLYAESMIKAYDAPTARLARRALAINAQLLREHLEENPRSQETATMLLDFSVRLGDGDIILYAIRSLVPGVEDGTGDVPAAYAALAADISGWLGSTIETDRRRRIVLALARLRLARAGAYIARVHPGRGKKAFLAEPDVSRVLAYADFLDGLEDVLTAAYRARARGVVAPSIAVGFDRLGAAFVATVPAAAKSGTYDRATFADYLRREFGTRLHWTKDNRDLLLGHVVGREENEVSAYGITAAVETEHVSFMVAKGYEAFVLGDAIGASQGWADGDTVIKTAGTSEGSYTGEALWQRCGAPVDEVKRAYELRDMSQGDVALAEANPITFLPALRARLEWQACRGLMHMLRQSGLEGDQLERSFIGEADYAITQGNIEGYQTRRAVDQARLGDAWNQRPAAEHEFHALLAQVITSPRPRFALAESIVVPGLGGETAAGQARGRLLKGLTDWMRAHAAQVVALDTARPLLVQLDHLSDRQIHAACREMDPLAKAETAQ
ncbi:hypothetical protein [Kordiimonas aestuarii]|uniref:hypothetical protein n=1 Tax=Kordiimonas aestuarii TaxID=1005925 RepID=UPI0021D2A331|nr:hypothetical protein [Kordiimonas aestuarii]